MIRAMTWARLAFKLQPSSMGFAAVVCLALAAAAFWLVSDMRTVLEACGAAGEPKACQVIYAFQDTHGQAVQLIQMGIGLATFGIPLVLGVPMLTQEIEQKTAMIAWPLAEDGFMGFADLERRNAIYATARERLEAVRDGVEVAGIGWADVPVFECDINSRENGVSGAAGRPDRRPT